MLAVRARGTVARAQSVHLHPRADVLPIGSFKRTTKFILSKKILSADLLAHQMH